MIARNDAASALAAKGSAERSLAELAVCPPWRQAAFAGVCSLLVVSPAAPIAMRFGLLVLIFASIALIVRSDRRRLGVFVNGYRRGRTRLVTFPLLAIMLAAYVASSYFSEVAGVPLFSIVLSVAMFGAAWIGGILWQRMFVRELGA